VLSMNDVPSIIHESLPFSPVVIIYTLACILFLYLLNGFKQTKALMVESKEKITKQITTIKKRTPIDLKAEYLKIFEKKEMLIETNETLMNKETTIFTDTLKTEGIYLKTDGGEVLKTEKYAILEENQDDEDVESEKQGAEENNEIEEDGEDVEKSEDFVTPIEETPVDETPNFIIEIEIPTVRKTMTPVDDNEGFIRVSKKKKNKTH